MSIAMALLGNKMSDKMKGIVGGAQPYGQQVASGGLGMLLGRKQAKWNDKRQLEQQAKLQELQIGGAKELSDYSYAKQLQMWKDTNYSAQGAELEKAGLNKGLIYGMSGGGGTTTGSGGGGIPTGGNAPSGGGEQLALMQTGLGLQMQKAQVENINANTEKTKADTDKTKGVDTAEAESRINVNMQNLELIVANTNYTLAQEEFTRFKSVSQDLENKYNQATIEERIGLIKEAHEQAQDLTEIVQNNKEISNGTKRVLIRQASASLNETIARTAMNNQQVKNFIANENLTISQTNLTNQQTKTETERTKLTGNQAYNIFKQTTWIDVLNTKEIDLKRAYQSYNENMTRNNDMPVSEQVYTNMVKSFIGTTMDNVLGGVK